MTVNEFLDCEKNDIVHHESELFGAPVCRVNAVLQVKQFQVGEGSCGGGCFAKRRGCNDTVRRSRAITEGAFVVDCTAKASAELLHEPRFKLVVVVLKNLIRFFDNCAELVSIHLHLREREVLNSE